MLEALCSFIQFFVLAFSPLIVPHTSPGSSNPRYLLHLSLAIPDIFYTWPCLVYVRVCSSDAGVISRQHFLQSIQFREYVTVSLILLLFLPQYCFHRRLCHAIRDIWFKFSIHSCLFMFFFVVSVWICFLQHLIFECFIYFLSSFCIAVTDFCSLVFLFLYRYS